MRQAKGTAAWSFKAGEKGRNRVRVFEDTARGAIFAEVVETDPLTGKRERKRFALGHADRDRAKGVAERMALALREHERTPEVLTLAAVSHLYLASVTPKKSAQTQRHDRSVIPLFSAVSVHSEKRRTSMPATGNSSLPRVGRASWHQRGHETQPG